MTSGSSGIASRLGIASEVEGFLARVKGEVAQVGDAISKAASNGDFATALADAQEALDALDGADIANGNTGNTGTLAKAGYGATSSYNYGATGSYNYGATGSAGLLGLQSASFAIPTSVGVSGYSGSPNASVGGSAAGLRAIGTPSNLIPTFEAAAKSYGLSPALLAAVAKQESGFDPSSVSSAGAEGIMQIMPGTASEIGVDPFDPTEAIYGAAEILANNLRRFSSVALALAAYNAGVGAVERYGGIPPYRQTEDYVRNVMAIAREAGWEG
jgi:soluble lytic murein transglycosylase-like protein